MWAHWWLDMSLTLHALIFKDFCKDIAHCCACSQLFNSDYFRALFLKWDPWLCGFNHKELCCKKKAMVVQYTLSFSLHREIFCWTMFIILSETRYVSLSICLFVITFALSFKTLRHPTDHNSLSVFTIFAVLKPVVNTFRLQSFKVKGQSPSWGVYQMKALKEQLFCQNGVTWPHNIFVIWQIVLL